MTASSCCFQGDWATFSCQTSALIFLRQVTVFQKQLARIGVSLGERKNRKSPCAKKEDVFQKLVTGGRVRILFFPLKPDILLGALSPAEEHGGCMNKKRKEKKNLKILLKVSPGEKKQF